MQMYLYIVYVSLCDCNMHAYAFDDGGGGDFVYFMIANRRLLLLSEYTLDKL